MKTNNSVVLYLAAFVGVLLTMAVIVGLQPSTGGGAAVLCIDAPADGEVFSYDSATGNCEWETNAGGGGGGTHPVAMDSDVSGTLSSANGGTGQVLATEDAVLVGNGSEFVGSVSVDCDAQNWYRTQYDGLLNNFACNTSQLSLTAAVSGVLPIANGGTAGATAAAARSALNVDVAGTDNSTAVTVAGTPDYITLAGQVLTRNLVDMTADITGIVPIANGGLGFADSPLTHEIAMGSGGGYIHISLPGCYSVTAATARLHFNDVSGLFECETGLWFGTDISTGTLTTGNIGDDEILEVDLDFTNTPTDGFIATFDSGSGGFTWESNSAAAVPYGRIEDASNAPLLTLPLGWLTRSLSTRVFTAGNLHYFPFYTPTSIGVDAVAHEITSADAGGLARACLYEATTDFLPGDLVVDTGTFSTAATATVTTSFTEETLSAGHYMWALVTDGTVTFRAVRGQTTMYSEINPALSTSPYLQTISVSGQTADVAGGCDDPATAPVTYSYASVGFYLPLFMRISTP